MQFKLFLLGAILLVCGLLAYSSIPNIHTFTIYQAQPLPEQAPMVIPGNGATQIAKNLTLFQESQNQLQVNITVKSELDQSSTVLLKIFRGNDTASCLNPQKPYLVDEEVSNQTLRTPIRNSGLYCFDFENLASQNPKTVTMTASINANSIQEHIANDGGINMGGLGIAAIGFLLATVGLAKKTVIPWE